LHFANFKRARYFTFTPSPLVVGAGAFDDLSVDDLSVSVLPDVPVDVPLLPLDVLEPSEFVFLLDTLGLVLRELSGFMPLSSAARAGSAAHRAAAAATAKTAFMIELPFYRCPCPTIRKCRGFAGKVPKALVGMKSSVVNVVHIVSRRVDAPVADARWQNRRCTAFYHCSDIATGPRSARLSGLSRALGAHQSSRSMCARHDNEF
jgi:hypothetical protein